MERDPLELARDECRNGVRIAERPVPDGLQHQTPGDVFALKCVRSVAGGPGEETIPGDARRYTHNDTPRWEKRRVRRVVSKRRLQGLRGLSVFERERLQSAPRSNSECGVIDGECALCVQRKTDENVRQDESKVVGCAEIHLGEGAAAEEAVSRVSGLKIGSRCGGCKAVLTDRDVKLIATAKE